MTGRPATGREPGQVRSVCKAMDLLACLAQARGPLTLGELSRRTGIPKATVHGLLSAMRPSAVVEQSGEDGRYRLGVRLFEYGCVVSRGWNVLEAAAGPMRRVAEETGETVSIAALDREEVLVLDCADAHSDLRVVSEKALNRSATSNSSSSSGISVNKVAVDSRLQPQGQSIIWAQAVSTTCCASCSSDAGLAMAAPSERNNI